MFGKTGGWRGGGTWCKADILDLSLVTWAEKPLKVPHVGCPSQDEPPLNVQERTNFKPNVPPAHLSWIYRVSRILHSEKALSERTPLLGVGTDSAPGEPPTPVPTCLFHNSWASVLTGPPSYVLH